MAEIPILLLAAGASSRMGSAKQLLPWGTHTLIEHQVQTLLKTGQAVVVVLGHLSEHLVPLLKPFPVVTLIHTHWDKGMGSSIAFGTAEVVKEFPEACGTLITQLDQPLITEFHYKEMLGAFQPDSNQIIVSRSSTGWEGVPVLFDRHYFKALQLLRGEEGARKIFRDQPGLVKGVESRDLLEDMDTPEAYEQLLAQFNRRSGDGAR
jgi:molybdenum cofactor cytidylyltransferase